MKTVTFEAKEQLYQLCRDICSIRRSFYIKNVDAIEQHGAIVKIDYFFRCRGKYTKFFESNKRSDLVICTYIYPAKLSMSNAERKNVCQCYYSRVGIITEKATTYQLNTNENEDKGMTAFFKRYTKRLIDKPVDVALQDRVLDVIANVIFPKRQGSSFNKTYRGFPVMGIVVIALLIFLFLFRLATPTGYHPSLK